MKKRRPVYCRKCAHLLLVKRVHVLPLCVALANFTGGALRERVNIKGVVLAEKRNKRNDCSLYRRIWFGHIPKKIRDLKEWARGDVNADYAEIEEYPVKNEEERVKKFLTQGHRRRKKRKAVKRETQKIIIKAESNLEEEALRAEEAFTTEAEEGAAPDSAESAEVSFSDESGGRQDLRDVDGIDSHVDSSEIGSPVSEDSNSRNGDGGEADL